MAILQRTQVENNFVKVMIGLDGVLADVEAAEFEGQSAIHNAIPAPDVTKKGQLDEFPDF